METLGTRIDRRSEDYRADRAAMEDLLRQVTDGEVGAAAVTYRRTS